MVEHLASKHEARSSNASTVKKKKTKENVMLDKKKLSVREWNGLFNLSEVVEQAKTICSV
jgi:hypothetical protein